MLKSERTSYMLDDRHFAVVLALAVLMHLGGFVVWTFSPKTKVQDIPIRTLNVRLGENDELAPEMLAPVPPSVNAPQVEAILDKIAAAPLPKSEPAPDAARQYVREMNPSKEKKAGRRDGKRDAEMVSRYTQMISLWIEKFKLYPPQAKAQGLKGTPVVRIRIDRRGNIRYQALERPTGIELLDRAAIDMIRRANPVPAVPSDYPPGDGFEFLIPVNFNLL